MAKSGVHCHLKCKTGIFASANPTTGSYKKEKSLKDNTKVSNAILSRFDLIFLLVDSPDPDRDRKLSEHIMKMNNNGNRKKNRVDERYRQKQNEQRHEYLSLKEKLIKETQLEEIEY